MSTALAKWVLVIAAVFHFAGAVACETKIINAPTHIGLVGCITRDAATALIDALNRNPRNIVIQSEGGDVAAAIRIAEEIRRHHLSILIRGYCHSSCSNYILPAAQSVNVEVGSAIVYHGDARLTLEVFSNRNYIDPMLLFTLEELSKAEEALERRSIKVSLIHALQRIAIAKTEREISVELEQHTYRCHGMGLLPWSPSLTLLIELGIVDHIVPVDTNTLPEILFRTQNLGMDSAIHGENPFNVCKKAMRQ